MKSKIRELSRKNDLRQRAVETLQKKPPAAPAFTPLEFTKLTHELSVHQIELEMQNDELYRIQTEAEESRRKYADLFEFAPAGYFVLDARGSIIMANLAGATLLGVERSALIGKRFSDYINRDDQDAYFLFRKKMVDTGVGGDLEIRLENKDAAPVYALLMGVAVKEPATGDLQWRIAVMDITVRKHLENTQNFLLQCASPDTGKDFFESLAKYLAQSLGMEYVCIDRLEGDGLTARTMAVYNDGQFETNVTYALKDTPCGDVVGKTICCFREKVRTLFPDDAALRDLKAESYIGTTLWSYDGRPIGLIAVIGRRPLADPEVAETMLKLVAVRAAGELERKLADAELKKQAADLRIINNELTQFNLAMVGRELRMIELKKQVDELCVRLGEPPRYLTDKNGNEGSLK